MDLKPFIAQAKTDLAALIAIDTVSAQGRNLEDR